MQVELQDQIDPALTDPPGCRAAGSAARRCARPSSTSACRRCARATCRPSSSTRWSRSTRSTSASASSASWCSSRSTCAPEEIFTRVRLLLVLLGLAGSSTPGATSTRWSSASGSTRDSLVVELASNDGYLLQYFVRAGHPGARHRAGGQRRRGGARARASRRVVEFFGASSPRELVGRGPAGRPARRQQRARPGARPQRLRRRHEARCSRRDGVVTLEFPHLLRLIEENQFDTIYHEHFSYFSFLTAERDASRRHGLDGLRRRGAADARRLAAGLRAHADDAGQPVPTARRRAAAQRETARGPRPARGTTRRSREQVDGDQAEAARVPDRAPSAQGKRVAGYGAPGKGNTLLNYCGIRTDFLDYTVDRNPYKQGKFLPGHAHPDPCRPRRIDADAARLRPDPALEPARTRSSRQLRLRRDWGGRFVVPIPEVDVIDRRSAS